MSTTATAAMWTTQVGGDNYPGPTCYLGPTWRAISARHRYQQRPERLLNTGGLVTPPPTGVTRPD